jgi:hypothetical protein
VGTPERRPQLFEVVDPYLHDRAAQEAFSRAERVGRRLGLQRRYVYVPAQEEPDGVRQVWKTGARSAAHFPSCTTSSTGKRHYKPPFMEVMGCSDGHAVPVSGRGTGDGAGVSDS